MPGAYDAPSASAVGSSSTPPWGFLIVVQQSFFLKPSKTVNELVGYCIAEASTRHGVLVHAVIVEANHYHLVLTDPYGKLPEFERDLDTWVARALNATYGRGEAFWSPGSYSNTEIHDVETLLDRLCYVMGNATKDGLIRTPEEWPGLLTLPEDLGTQKVYSRPKNAFFGGKRPPEFQPAYRNGRRVQKRPRRVDPLQEKHKRRKKRSSMPEQATLEISLPPQLADMGLEAARALVRERLNGFLERVYAKRAAEGKTHFMGAQAVLDQNVFDSAGDTFPSFARNKRIAEPRDAVLRIRLLSEFKNWRVRYRLALSAWQAGNRDALFPYGTYWQRVFHKSRARSAPLSLAA